MIAFKILNLYAGIGGNRKRWNNVEVVAVENDEDAMTVYADYFPGDGRIMADAHQYLRDHFHEFDLIWTSPPCPTHSHVRNVANVGRGQSPPVFPDMELYEEIIFLQQAKQSNWKDWDGEFVVENVRSYYNPLIEPQEVGRHYLWASFAIPSMDLEPSKVDDMRNAQQRYGFDLRGYDFPPKKKGTLLKNCVHPKLGKHILNAAANSGRQSLKRFVTKGGF